VVWSSRIGAGLVTGLAAILTIRSLRWPLVHDGPLLHYIAARILDGAAPYRDLFDMNFPGVYVVHVLALRLFGPGDAGFRAFDLTLLGLVAVGLFLMVTPHGRAAGVLAAALFWLYHVAGGPWRTAQRDLILCLPLAAAAIASLSYARTGRGLALGVAGLALGSAAWIKPHALVLAPLVAALAWRPPGGRGDADRAARLLTLAVGCLVPAVPVLVWLGMTQSLGAFLDIVGGYLVPLYSRLGRDLLWPMLWLEVGPWVLVGLGLWALFGLIALRRNGAASGETAILGAGAAYGVLHFLLQGKGWGYHLYPLALFAIALGAAGLGTAARAGRRGLVVALAGALGLTVTGVWAKGVPNLDPHWVAAASARAQAVAQALRPVVAAGGTVEVLDTNDGGIHALFLLGARQPTRFLYDFHFYHDAGHPYVDRLRRELLDELRAAEPTAVVLFQRGWPHGGYDRLAGFPALEEWLRAGYRQSAEGDGYRVFERKVAAGAGRAGTAGARPEPVTPSG
jgi:hypothetical protein